MSEKQIIKWYIIGTFSLTFIVWGIILIANQFGYLTSRTIMFWIFYIVGGLSPTILGAILSKRSGKISSYKELIKEIFSVKQPLKYYFIILILFAVSFGIPAIRNELTSKMAWYIGIPYIIYMFFFGGLEEVGWRYIFQPALEKYMPYEVASFIVGCFWAIWHYPLFLMDGINKGSNFGIFVISVFGMSFMLGAIYRVTKSLWLCVLFHAMINAYLQIWVNSENITNPLLSVIISTIIKIIVAIIIVRVHSYLIKKKESK